MFNPALGIGYDFFLQAYSALKQQAHFVIFFGHQQLLVGFPPLGFGFGLAFAINTPPPVEFE
jgi:hypothetical protein